MPPQTASQVLVFSDGACSGNPGPGGWGSILVYPEGRVRELGGRENPTTNNRMEITGAMRALEALADWKGGISIHTDSTYLIQGITQWIWGWRKRDWKTADGKDVANAELWQRLAQVLSRRDREQKVDWKYVRGHAGIPGNDRADEIAVGFATGRRVELFDGKLLEYPIAIHDIPEDTSVPKRDPARDAKAKKSPAHSYLSLVNGVLERHATWAQCEARVKGRPGAKFKKAVSAADEARILSDWGVGSRRPT